MSAEKELSLTDLWLKSVDAWRDRILQMASVDPTLRALTLDFVRRCVDEEVTANDCFQLAKMFVDEACERGGTEQQLERSMISTAIAMNMAFLCKLRKKSKEI